ncbi:MAG TPA: protein-glutamate O-methyltransferase CheR [bacterium]|nr:protein-glutamate O-methyltransferase CheR [bacterium]
MSEYSSILKSRSLRDREFEKISEMVYAICRINLHVGKKELVQARLNKRLRILNIDSYKEYLKYLENDDTGAELSTMVDVLTTNLTFFFREPDHFEYLSSEVKQKMAAGKLKKFRIWSAGCSSGEEAYTTAIVLKETLKETAASTDIKILATDISSRILETARAGVFIDQRFRTTPDSIKKKYFTEIKEPDGSKKYIATNDLKKEISFKRLNLMDSWPMKGPFDVVFCRNVMIYFDKETQTELVSRFYDILAPGGIFFVGHSESLTGTEHNFRYVRPSIYQKD